MKKTPRWRQMRLQRKREKARLRKQVKANRDVDYHGPYAGDASFEHIFGWLNTPVRAWTNGIPTILKRIDRRKRNGQQGNR